jgi:hypothetical protein
MMAKPPAAPACGRAQALELQIHRAGLQHQVAQALQAAAGDAAVGQPVEFEDVHQRLGRAARTHRLLPADLAVGVGDGLDLLLGRQLGLAQAALVDAAAGKCRRRKLTQPM